MEASAALRGEVVTVWDGRLEVSVKIAGSGPPLFFAHSAGGPRWIPFLDWLAESHTVYAPDLPGTTAGKPRMIDNVETFADLVLAYEELVRALGIEGAVAIGESFGGMTIADMAATFTSLFSKLVLLSPAGLWLDDHPPLAVELTAARPERAPEYLFWDPSSDTAQDFFRLPEDPDLIPGIIASLVWAQGCASKFLWPIPDQGLAKRLHRVTVPTLIVFGRQDRVIPAEHGAEFARLIPGSRLELIDDCGHIPQIERAERTRELVGEFLAG